MGTSLEGETCGDYRAEKYVKEKRFVRVNVCLMEEINAMHTIGFIEECNKLKHGVPSHYEFLLNKNFFGRSSSLQAKANQKRYKSVIMSFLHHATSLVSVAN